MSLSKNDEIKQQVKDSGWNKSLFALDGDGGICYFCGETTVWDCECNKHHCPICKNMIDKCECDLSKPPRIDIADFETYEELREVIKAGYKNMAKKTKKFKQLCIRDTEKIFNELIQSLNISQDELDKLNIQSVYGQASYDNMYLEGYVNFDVKDAVGIISIGFKRNDISGHLDTYKAISPSMTEAEFADIPFVKKLILLIGHNYWNTLRSIEERNFKKFFNDEAIDEALFKTDVKRGKCRFSLLKKYVDPYHHDKANKLIDEEMKVRKDKFYE